MRNFQETFFEIRRQAMRKMDRQSNFADTMRALGHRPLGIDSQFVPRDIVARAELSDKIPDATGHRSDEQFDGTHPGILPAVVYRLIRDDTMSSACDVVTHPTMVCHGQFHHAPPLAGNFAGSHGQSEPTGRPSAKILATPARQGITGAA
jgi:hypothetical protein